MYCQYPNTASENGNDFEVAVVTLLLPCQTVQQGKHFPCCASKKCRKPLINCGFSPPRAIFSLLSGNSREKPGRCGRLRDLRLGQRASAREIALPALRECPFCAEECDCDRRFRGLCALGFRRYLPDPGARPIIRRHDPGVERPITPSPRPSRAIIWRGRKAAWRSI
jgi:hypothetical protein